MSEKTSDIVFMVQNSVANAGQAPQGASSANNFSFEPQVQDLGRIMRGGQDDLAQPPARLAQSGALFGTHLREAAAIVKDWIRNP